MRQARAGLAAGRHQSIASGIESTARPCSALVAPRLRVIMWSSSALCAVAPCGLVIGVSVGTATNSAGVEGWLGDATITATSEGRSGSATLVVTAAGGVSVCAQIAGASVYGCDGRDYTVFLGKLTNRFDTQSIYNQFGTYGSRFSSSSIYNPYSQWGSRYSDRSAFDSYAKHPPVLVKGATGAGVLHGEPVQDAVPDAAGGGGVWDWVRRARRPGRTWHTRIVAPCGCPPPPALLRLAPCRRPHRRPAARCRRYTRTTATVERMPPECREAGHPWEGT